MIFSILLSLVSAQWINQKPVTLTWSANNVVSGLALTAGKPDIGVLTGLCTPTFVSLPPRALAGGETVSFEIGNITTTADSPVCSFRVFVAYASTSSSDVFQSLVQVSNRNGTLSTAQTNCVADASGGIGMVEQRCSNPYQCLSTNLCKAGTTQFCRIGSC